MSNELQHVSGSLGSQHIHAAKFTAAQPTGVQHAAGPMPYWPNGAATAHQQPGSHGNTPTPAAFIAAVQQSLQAAAGPSNAVSVGFPSGVSTHGGSYVTPSSSLPPASQWRQLPPYVSSGENRAAAARPSPQQQQQQQLQQQQRQQHLPALQQQEGRQHSPHLTHAHQTMGQQVHAPPVKQPVPHPQLAQLQQASAPRGASPTLQQQQKQGRQGLMHPPMSQGNAAQRPQLFLTQQQVMQILQFQQRQQLRQQQQQQQHQHQQEQQRPAPAAPPPPAASSGSAAAGQAFNQQEVLRQALATAAATAAAAAAAAAGRVPINNMAPPSSPAAAQAAAAAGPLAAAPTAGAGTYVGHVTPYRGPTNRGAAACGSGGGGAAGAAGGGGSAGHRTAGGAATKMQTHAKPAAVPRQQQQQKQYEVHQGALAAEQQQQQEEGFSQEVLTLLTMIAATAVYGAAESEASGKPLAPAFNPRVLTAAKRFLSALVSIDDHTVHEEDEEQQAGAAAHPSPTPEAMAAAAAAAAAPATDEQLADAAAAAAAMALCSLPRESRGCDRSSSDVGGGYEGLDEDRGLGQQGYRLHFGQQRVAARKRGRPRKSDAVTTAGYTGATGRPPTGGRGGRGRRPIAGGRSGLMALLQAVEEHDHYSTGAEGYDMDWAAPGAENDMDMEGEPEQLGRGGRRRRAAAKRPRYLDDSSSDLSSESGSIDSSGNRRYAADTEQELDSIALSPHKGSRHRARMHASRRGTSEDLHPSSVLYSRAAAAAGVGATGQRNRGRGPSPAPPKKHRWVAGANQWVTDDGLVVWPKDTLVTPDQRVFYVAFKWVQQHWPHYVRAGQHVSEVPVTVYLDGEEAATAGIEFVAKIRIYNTAAHLVITPYSKLSGLFKGTFMAGYAFNPHTHSIRVYLSTEQPGAEPAVGKTLSQQPAVQSEGPPPALADSSAAADADADRLAAAPGSLHQAAFAAEVAPYMQQQQQHVAGPGGARAESAAPADQSSEEMHRAAAKSAAGRAAVNVRWEKYRAQRRAQQSESGATDGMTADESMTLQQGQEWTPAAVSPVPLGAPAATNVTPMGPGTGQLVAPAGTAAAAPAGRGVVRLGSASVSGLAGPPSGSSGEANAAGSSTTQWEQLEQQLGLSAAGDASAINNTVLCVSEALQLPDELVAKLPGQLLQGLNVGGANKAAEGTQGVEGAERQQPQEGVVPAAIKAWYQQLCGAVAARDSSQVTYLMQRLGSELLVAGQ